MMNLWLSNVPPSSSTILLSKMHPQLKVEFHTLMNPIKEVKPLWKIQGSMDQRVLAGVLPTEKKQVTMDAATACSLGFALIGAWLLGYRPGSFFVWGFSISRGTCRIRFWDHWNSWLFVGIVWKQPLYKSKTYHITILHHWFDEWKANYSKFNEIDFIDDAWGRLCWWMGFPTANTLYGNFPLLCPQWLVWAEPVTPNGCSFPVRPLLHTPCRATVEVGHLPEILWFNICFFDVSSVWRVIWDRKFQIFVHEQTSNEMLCILLRNLGGSFPWSWISMAGGDPSDLHTDVWSWFTAKQRFPHLLQQTGMDSWTSETQRIAGDHHLSQFGLPAHQTSAPRTNGKLNVNPGLRSEITWNEASFELVFLGSMFLFGGVSITFELSCN